MGRAPFCFVSPAQWDSTWAHSRKDGNYTLDAFRPLWVPPECAPSRPS